MNSFEIYELTIIVLSVVSCMFSLTIMMTYFAFKDMRKKSFMKFIFYISLSDFFMNVTSAFGFPNTGTALCWIQAIGENYFALASWFWTTALSYSIFSIIKNGKRPFKMWHAHMICWTLPAILTALPLTTDTYGASDVDTQWCLIISRPSSAPWMTPFWSYAAFFAWLFLCIALMIYWTYIIYYRTHFQNVVMNDIVKKSYDKVSLYPVAMVLCWALNYCCITVLSNQDTPLLVFLSMIFGISYGIATAIIFMIKSEEAPRRWYDLFFSWGIFHRPSENMIPIDFNYAEDDSLNDPMLHHVHNSGSTNPFSVNSNFTGGSGMSNYSSKHHSSTESDNHL